MTAFLEFWDQVELSLVTLPFWLQIIVMLAFGVPMFALTALGVQWIADKLVLLLRAAVGAESGRGRRRADAEPRGDADHSGPPR